VDNNLPVVSEQRWISLPLNSKVQPPLNLVVVMAIDPFHMYGFSAAEVIIVG